MIPALLHILAMTAGAYAIGREIRDHHLGNWIRHACEYTHPDTSPRFWDVVFALNGKLLWPMLSFTVWAAITIALSTRSHQASMLSWLATFVAIWLMMLVSLWMGVIVTTLSMSLRMGLSMTGFITAPAFAFAGVGFPTFAMPIGARIWANLLPLTHYLKLQINQLQMNAPFWWAIPSLLGFTTAVVILLLLSSALTLRVLKQPERWGAR
jgi:ABC-2 type transport system permease protein